MDLHKNYLQVAVVDDEGKLLKQERILNTEEAIETFSTSLDDKTEIVIESSTTWYHAYELLTKHHHVILSNPVKTKERKTGLLDSENRLGLALVQATQQFDMRNSMLDTARFIGLEGL